MEHQTVIIGGGPAGMMAAATASMHGKQVVLLEKNDRLGRKLLITGKGRCNVTNDCDTNEFIKNIPTNPKFLYSAINQFSTEDTKQFFENLGVQLKTERGNRVFPVSDRAADVCDAMVKCCKKNNVKVLKANASDILVSSGHVVGVVTSNGEKISAKSVVLATGGMSYPLTGSTGDGYKIARKLGHTVTEIKPSLVPIVSNEEMCSDMQGLSLKNIELKLIDSVKNKVIYKELGEMIFTHFGVSGPLVLSASAHIKKVEHGRYHFLLDMKPGLSHEQLDARILRDFQKYSNKDFMNSLGDLLPKKMIPIMVQLVINQSGITPFTKVNQITKEQRKCIVEQIKGIRISIDGFRPIDEAIITSGGIDVTEIDPRTMESKLISGLFFAGEIVDVDGYTGGFNLQIAYSTGYLCGLNC